MPSAKQRTAAKKNIKKAGCEEKAHDRASSQGDAHGFGKTGSESGKAETCSVAKERNKRSTAKPGDKAFRTGELARR